MTKIDKMTPEQEAKIPEYLNRYLKDGRRTTPLNQTKVEELITKLYEEWLGEAKPIIVYCQSPLQLCIFPSIYREIGKLGSENNLRDNLENNLRDNLRNNLENNLWNNLWNNLRDNLWNNQHITELSNIYWCSWWWNYRAVYEFAHTELIGSYPQGCEEKLNFVNELSREVHAINPYKGICFVSDFPTAINIDDRGRLHNESGPAISYPDSYSVYAIHGVRLEGGREKYIQDRSTITVEAIEAESANAEIRRVMVDMYGLENYLKDSGSEKIHEDDFGVLFRKTQTGDEDLVMVKVVNSTPEPDGSYKDYFIRVPPTVKTAREAVAWTFGLDPEKYQPLVQT